MVANVQLDSSNVIIVIRWRSGTVPENVKSCIFNLLITKGLGISKVNVCDVGVSDDGCVYFERTISAHTIVSTEVKQNSV